MYTLYDRSGNPIGSFKTRSDGENYMRVNNFSGIVRYDQPIRQQPQQRTSRGIPIPPHSDPEFSIIPKAKKYIPYRVEPLDPRNPRKKLYPEEEYY